MNKSFNKILKKKFFSNIFSFLSVSSDVNNKKTTTQQIFMTGLQR